MNKTQKMYYDALASVEKKGIKPTKASVAKEAERDPSSIKPKRFDWMDILIDDIDEALKRYEKKQENSPKEKTKKLQEKLEECKQELSEALARELMLIKKVRELENRIKDIERQRMTLVR